MIDSEFNEGTMKIGEFILSERYTWTVPMIGALCSWNLSSLQSLRRDSPLFPIVWKGIKPKRFLLSFNPKGTLLHLDIA